MFPWGISNATFFFASLLGGVVLLWRSWAFRKQATDGEQIFRAFLILGCALAAAMCVPSVLAIQKWLTKVVMPPGLIWLALLLFGVVLWKHRLRKLSVLAWVLWVMLTLGGSETVSRRLMAGLEADFAKIDPLAVASRYEPFDLVVSLGGATKRSPAGQVELTEAGDRVLLAARLYHAGHTKALASTGEVNLELLGPDRHPADEARALWQGLKIPRDAIFVLAGGTTQDEFQVIAREARRRNWKKIGVVTSAWHMRRALRQAEAAGLTVSWPQRSQTPHTKAVRQAEAVGLVVVPLPANFMGVVPSWDRLSIVPSGQGLYETSRALKEHLARLVGR